jgi:hypothetical protein
MHFAIEERDDTKMHAALSSNAFAAAKSLYSLRHRPLTHQLVPAILDVA